jgi:NADH dehydrogenase FAD-containing subunit
MPTHIAKVAENELSKLNVKIIKGTKITSTAAAADGKAELTLSDGKTLLTDLYLPTVGVVPSSEFIPKTLLSDKGEVVVDAFLKVKGADGVWAAGDITDLEPSQLVNADKQGAALAKNLDAVLKGKEPMAYKYGGKGVMGLSLGRSRATGRSGDSKIPSIIIWWFSEFSLRLLSCTERSELTSMQRVVHLALKTCQLLSVGLSFRSSQDEGEDRGKEFKG